MIDLRIRWMLILALPLAAAAAACSSDNTADGGTTGDTGTGGKDATAGADATGGNMDATGGNMDAMEGADAAGGMDAQAGMDATIADTGMGGGTDAAENGDASTSSRGSGNVTLNQFVIPVGMMTFNSYSASAGFSGAVAGGGGCSFSTTGACLITTCVSGGDAAMAPDVSAGAVTISGGMISPDVVLMPDGVNQYMTDNRTNMLAFAGGETITYSAAGAAGGVPAFNTTLTAPHPITLTAPMVVTGQTTNVPRASDLAVGWTTSGGGGGDVRVLLASNNNGTHVVTCTFAQAAGSGTIPSAALMSLPQGTGVISASASASTTVTAGNFDVFVNVSQSAATGQADFQ